MINIDINKRTQVVCFDVDDTLVIWGMADDPNAIEFENVCKNSEGNVFCSITEHLVPHKKHIEQIKKHHEAKNLVIVWSGGGAEWAEEVVTKLGLKEYVDLCLSKPVAIYDNEPISNWMPSPIWMEVKEEENE